MSVNLGTAVGYLDLDTSKFTKGFLGAQKMLNGFNEKSFTGKLDSVGKAMSSVGGSMTKTLTAPIAILGATAAKSGASFESAMSQVAATMGKTRGEIQDLADTAVEMGSTTSFSATEAAEGLNYLALAGYDSKQQIAALPKVLTLAAAGNMDLAYASDMLTDSMSALGLASEDSEVLMNNMNLMVDQMAKTASQSNTSVAQLGEAILTVGGTAKDLAGGTVELNTVLGLMADNGIKASESGTHLRNILLAMQPTTDKAAEAWKQLGVSGYDAQGNLRPLEDTFSDLNKAMEGMNMEQKTELLQSMFNKTDLAAVNALLGTSSERWDELAGAIENSVGAGEKMQDVQLDNLTGDITLLKSAIEGLQIRFFELGNNALRSVVQHITKVVDWFNNLSDAQLELVEKIALIVAAIGPALLIGGKIISGILKMIVIIGKIKEAIMLVITVIKTFFALFATNPILIAITAIIAAVALLAKAWKDDFGGIQEKTKAFIDFMKDLPKKIGDFFTQTIEKAKTFVKEFPEKAKEAATKFIDKTKEKLTALPENVGEFLGKVIGKAVKFVIEFPAKAKEAAINFVTNTVNFIKSLPNKVNEFLTQTIAKAKEFVTNFGNKAKEAAKNFLDKIVNGIKSVPSKVGEIKTKAVNALKDLPEKFKQAAKDAIDGFINGIKNKVKAVGNAVKDFASGFVNGFKKELDIHSPSRVMEKQIGEQIANGVIKGLNNKVKEGKLKAKEYADALISTAEKRLENFKVYNEMSLADEVAYWNKIRKELKKGTQNRIDADAKYYEAKKKFNEEVKKLDEEYKSNQEAIYKELNDSIEELNKKYEDAVSSRTNTILGAFKLFDEYNTFTETTASQLTANLQSQVTALANYNAQINALASRGIVPDELLEEIKNMGVDATGELAALNSMTDAELQNYVALWTTKMSLAKGQAEKELEPLKKETEEQIESLTLIASEKLDGLQDEYIKSLQELGVNAKTAAEKAGKDTTNSLSKAIDDTKPKVIESAENMSKSLKVLFEDMAAKTSQRVSEIMAMVAQAQAAMASIGTATSGAVSGSHKNGLDYVPYDGYVAKLHKGEAVLTAEENANRNGKNGDIINNFYGTPPLDEKETARQFKLAQQQLALNW